MKQIITSYKNAYSGHPKEIWTLFVLMIINRMGTMVFPFLTVYLTSILKFPLNQAGIIAGTFGVGGLLGSFLGGKLSDKIGYRLVISSTLAINGIILIFLPYASSFSALTSLIFAMGTFGEAYRPAVMSSVGSFVPDSKTGRSMSLIRLAISIGMSIAPLIGGFIAVSHGYLWLFWIDGLTCILAALYFWYSSRNWILQSTIKTQKELSGLKKSNPPYKDKNYMLYLLATFLLGIGFIQWFHTVPVFIKNEWGFDERYIGLMMGFHAILVGMFELPIVHAIEKSKKIKLSILAGLLIISLSFIPFTFPASIVLYLIAMLLFTVGDIFYLPFNNAIPVKMGPSDRQGEYMAWYWMIWSLTNIAGPVIGFSIADKFGFSSFWIFISVLVGLSFLMNKFLARKIIS